MERWELESDILPPTRQPWSLQMYSNLHESFVLLGFVRNQVRSLLSKCFSQPEVIVDFEVAHRIFFAIKKVHFLLSRSVLLNLFCHIDHLSNKIRWTTLNNT